MSPLDNRAYRFITDQNYVASPEPPSLAGIHCKARPQQLSAQLELSPQPMLSRHAAKLGARFVTMYIEGAAYDGAVHSSALEATRRVGRDAAPGAEAVNEAVAAVLYNEAIDGPDDIGTVHRDH